MKAGRCRSAYLAITSRAVFGAFAVLWLPAHHCGVVPSGMTDRERCVLANRAGDAHRFDGKDAILIVEFAKAEYEKGKPLIDATLAGARLRLRPILMTSLHVILWQRSVVDRSGSGSVSRSVIGTVVIGACSLPLSSALFLIPAIFYLVEKWSAAKNAALPKCPQHRAPLRVIEMKHPLILFHPVGDSCELCWWAARSALITANRSFRSPTLPTVRTIIRRTTPKPRRLPLRTFLVAGLAWSATFCVNAGAVSGEGVKERIRNGCHEIAASVGLMKILWHQHAGRKKPRARGAGRRCPHARPMRSLATAATRCAHDALSTVVI